MVAKYAKYFIVFLWMGLILISGYLVLKNQLSFENMIQILQNSLFQVKNSSWGWSLPLAFIVIFSLRPLLLIPTFVMNFVAFAVFGPWEGFVWVLIAEQISAITLYFAIKNLAGINFKHNIQNLAKRMRLNLQEHPHKQFYLVFVLRLASLPFDFVTALCALSHIRLRPFLGATVLVSAPWVALFFLTASSVQRGSWVETLISIATFGSFILVSGLVARRTGLINSGEVIATVLEEE